MAQLTPALTSTTTNSAPITQILSGAAQTKVPNIDIADRSEESRGSINAVNQYRSGNPMLLISMYTQLIIEYVKTANSEEDAQDFYIGIIYGLPSYDNANDTQKTRVDAAISKLQGGWVPTIDNTLSTFANELDTDDDYEYADAFESQIYEMAFAIDTTGLSKRSTVAASIVESTVTRLGGAQRLISGNTDLNIDLKIKGLNSKDNVSLKFYRYQTNGLIEISSEPYRYGSGNYWLGNIAVYYGVQIYVNGERANLYVNNRGYSTALDQDNGTQLHFEITGRDVDPSMYASVITIDVAKSRGAVSNREKRDFYNRSHADLVAANNRGLLVNNSGYGNVPKPGGYSGALNKTVERATQTVALPMLKAATYHSNWTTYLVSIFNVVANFTIAAVRMNLSLGDRSAFTRVVDGDRFVPYSGAKLSLFNRWFFSVATNLAITTIGTDIARGWALTYESSGRNNRAQRQALISTISAAMKSAITVTAVVSFYYAKMGLVLVTQATVIGKVAGSLFAANDFLKGIDSMLTSYQQWYDGMKVSAAASFGSALAKFAAGTSAATVTGLGSRVFGSPTRAIGASGVLLGIATVLDMLIGWWATNIY